MALSDCALVNSQALDCRSSVGGIKELKIKVLPSLTTISSNYSVASGVATVSGGSLTGWYTYDVEKETADYIGTANVSVENGTVFYEQVINWVLNKMSAAKRNDLQLLAKNRLHIAFRDNNDAYWLIGYQRGCDLTTGTSGTGKAMGDRNGYTFTFTGKEDAPELSLTSANYAQLVTA